MPALHPLPSSVTHGIAASPLRLSVILSCAGDRRDPSLLCMQPLATIPTFGENDPPTIVTTPRLFLP